MDNKQLHESGLNIIQNSDGSFAFEWDPKDKRWSWLNGLTDEQIKTIIEESVQTRQILESVSDELGFNENLGSNE
jgi:hypothetical protein